ncbi:MAG: hypothetical protein JWM85_1640 [Acidimicrobiaceae bacterium]|nr:hypothetical protein [Acidimicrobiaceae bacterium]
MSVTLAEIAAVELDRLEEVLRRLGRVVIAFSGGADSAFLARVATETLGKDNACCVTAVSASLAPEELEDCRALASEWDLSLVEVSTGELSNPAYARNDLDRCFHCKSELMEALSPIATQRAAVVVLGVNLDDLGEHRPGQRAASEQGAVFPLVEAGFTKARLREVSRQLGLRTWDKPAAACLASRLPHGTPVTFARLERVARAESGLRRLGLGQLRVRHHGDTARLEVEPRAMESVLARRTAVIEAVHEAGYRYVTLDLEGFRSGNLAQAALEEREQG